MGVCSEGPCEALTWAYPMPLLVPPPKSISARCPIASRPFFLTTTTTVFLNGSPIPMFRALASSQLSHLLQPSIMLVRLTLILFLASSLFHSLATTCITPCHDIINNTTSNKLGVSLYPSQPHALTTFTAQHDLSHPVKSCIP